MDNTLNEMQRMCTQSTSLSDASALKQNDVIEELSKENESIYSSSPFYRIFKEIGNSVIVSEKEHIENEYYSADFYELILKKYLLIFLCGVLFLFKTNT